MSVILYTADPQQWVALTKSYGSTITFAAATERTAVQISFFWQRGSAYTFTRIKRLLQRISLLLAVKENLNGLLLMYKKIACNIIWPCRFLRRLYVKNCPICIEGLVLLLLDCSADEGSAIMHILLSSIQTEQSLCSSSRVVVLSVLTRIYCVGGLSIFDKKSSILGTYSMKRLTSHSS